MRQKNIGKNISNFDKRIGKNSQKYQKLTVLKKIMAFLSLPNGEAQKLVKKLYYKYSHLKFIDSSDFRIENSIIIKNI